MDFWYYFQLQKEKLNRKVDIKHLIDENGKIQSNYIYLEDFIDHLPVLPDEFWQTNVENIIKFEKYDNFHLDDSLLQYIIILISWYTDENCSTERSNNSGTCSLLASQFYFHLLILNSNCFKENIYNNTLECLKKNYGGSKHNAYLNCLKALRRFLAHVQLNENYLERTVFQLCKIVEKLSHKVYTNFSVESSTDIPHEGLLCLKTLAIQNWSTKGNFIINYALFQGIKSEQDTNKMKKNFSNLIFDLKHVLKRDNFESFQNMFLYIITKSKYFDSMEAAKLLSTFDEQLCKNIIFKLINMGLSKEVSNKNNILKLFYTLLEHPPTNFYEKSKLEIFFQSLLNVCIINCLDNEEAIYILSKLCLIDKQLINKQFEILLTTSTEYICVEYSLPVFCNKFNMHWQNRARNKNIAIIILRIMCNTLTISSDERYASILTMIGNEADPSDMKITIPLLLNLLVESKRKHSKNVSDNILELMYLMAIHPSSGSSEFTKIIFQLILEPSENIQPFKKEILQFFSTLIINDNKKFIEKAKELKLLNDISIKKLINDIMEANYDALRITCAIVEKVSSPEGEKIIYHIMANPTLLCNAKYTADLLFLIYTGLDYFTQHEEHFNPNTVQKTNLSSFTKLLWDAMMKFHLPFNALGVSEDVLRSLAKLGIEPVDYQMFFETVNIETKNALLKLPEDTYAVPIMYSVELLSHELYNIPDENIVILENALTKILNLLKDQDNFRDKIKIHGRNYFCLTLMVRLSMKRSELGSKALDFVKSALSIANQEFRLPIMNLMYDLSTFVVHNFDEFLEYSFNDLKSTNMIVKKQAIIHIEHFIRLDYLKVSLEQFCKFICVLGDPLIEKSIQKLLINFIRNNQILLERYFIGLIMHINFYSGHSMCRMSQHYIQDMNCLIRGNFNKWKIHSTVIRSLPIRSRFLLLKEICKFFFEKFIKGLLKIEEGIWKVLNDSICLFKVMAYNSIDNIKYEEFYENCIQNIKKYIIDKKSIPSDTTLKYPEMKDDIEYITLSLLSLLFYTDNEAIQQNYKLKLFEAISFWTYDLLYDIISICHPGKEKISLNISNYYSKYIRFYENQKDRLNISRYISENNESNLIQL